MRQNCTHPERQPKSQSGLENQNTHVLRGKRKIGQIKLEHLGTKPDLDKYRMERDNQEPSHK